MNVEKQTVGETRQNYWIRESISLITNYIWQQTVALKTVMRKTNQKKSEAENFLPDTIREFNEKNKNPTNTAETKTTELHMAYPKLPFAGAGRGPMKDKWN